MPDYLSELKDKGILASIEKPSAARVYDYFLGGTNHYAIDRVFAEKQEATMPDIRDAMRSNRRFIGRAVRFALDHGVRQFVDIGSGLPSQGQAHQIADVYAPNAKAHVVYVDNEPIAHAHSDILLSREADPDRHKAVIADYYRPEELWTAVTKTGLIDHRKPVCILVTAILHFMAPDTHPEVPLTYYQRQAVPGSVLVLTHGAQQESYDELNAVVQNYAKTTNPAYLRTREEFAAFFGGWTLVEPGITWSVEWNPDGEERQWWSGQPERSLYLAGVAVKENEEDFGGAL